MLDDKSNFFRHYIYCRVMLKLAYEDALEIALDKYSEVDIDDLEFDFVYERDNAFLLYEAIRDIYKDLYGKEFFT